MRRTTSPAAPIAAAPGSPAIRRRGRGVLDRDWLLALSFAFFVGVGVWFAHSVHDFFAPPTTMIFVPSFVGQTENDALLQGGRYRLKTLVIARRNSDRFPKGVVIAQQPAAGDRVREGRQISLIVSNGVVIYTMPDLRYSTQREARLELSQRHLQLAKTAFVANDDVPYDAVVAQDPPPMTSVREGSRVSLELSKGPPSAERVPNFVGLRIDDARSYATDAKIHLGQLVWTPFGPHGPPRGVVVRQRPAANAVIDAFEPVSLQISAGPEEYGYLVRQVHATVMIPIRDETAAVRLEMRDQTGTWNVYNGWAQGGAKLDFNLTAVGTAQLDTFVNNELVQKSTLGVEPPRPKPTAGPAGKNAPPIPPAR